VKYNLNNVFYIVDLALTQITSPKCVTMLKFINLTRYAIPAVRESPTSTTFVVRSAYNVIILAKGSLLKQTYK
jgi:hypothetical protein